MTGFSWEQAFSRNLRLLSESEWAKVRSARIAIGGLGGCGSNHLLALARMGFENFVVADPDVFDLTNLNRQAGAYLSTLGQPKVEVMQRLVLDINPKARIEIYPEGLSAEMIPDFVSRADIGINAIDFFRVDLYAPYHNGFRDQGKYSIVGASPFAFGAAMTVIGPESDSFETVFGIDSGDSKSDQLWKFTSTLASSGFARQYLDPGVNEIRDPIEETVIGSSAAALHLCTALTTVEVLCIVTGRRQPILAPRVLEVDLLAQRWSVGSEAHVPAAAPPSWPSPSAWPTQ
ncbi:MAG: ThiF family adenylyltransferase [Acidimicrobiales bacterium]|nr:ThiF family adenylyltransferase [Acidimicrobiales bacterium]